MTYELFAGRERTRLVTPFSGARKLFEGELVEDSAVADADYKHCTFANASFKGTRLVHSSFFNCAFVRCYFRNTQLRRSAFVGCTFIDCDFPKTELANCDLRYAKFSGCYLTYDQAESSLPVEANLRADLVGNLGREAGAAGAGRDARRFRLEGISATERHLWQGVRGATQYHRDHFPFPWGWAGALVRYAASRVNGLLWGYGEKAWILVTNMAVLTLLVFPILLRWVAAGIATTGDDLAGLDFVYLSLANVLPMQGAPGSIAIGTGARLVFIAESFVGLVASGLFVTLLFRWIVRR